MFFFKLWIGIWSVVFDLKVLFIYDFFLYVGFCVECIFLLNMMSVIWVYVGYDINGVCVVRLNCMNNFVCIVCLCWKFVFIFWYFILYVYE